MVRDYIRQLYTPAAITGRALNSDYKGATELAAWKKTVRAGWADVRVEHVESHGVSDNPEVGSSLTVRAFVALGSLTPDDVAVEVVHGVIDGDDEIVNTVITPLTLADSYDGGRHRFDGDILLQRGGAFGYTVRIVPRHSVLTSVAEMGLVALP
jgi:starch phosphorylase